MAGPVVWSDIYQDINKDAQGDIKVVQNVFSVATSIDNILGTRQGERVMLPEFASVLSDMLFEPITEELMSKLSNEVKRVIEAWDNRVKVLGVDYYADPDGNEVDIEIEFSIRGYSETFSYTRSLT